MSENSIKPLELVVSAIHCLRESRGSSPQDILKYLEKKYNVGKEVLKPHIQTGLRRGISFGLITQESGLYRLNDMLSDPVDVISSNVRKPTTVKINKRSFKGRNTTKKRILKKTLPKKKRRVNFKSSMASQKSKKKIKGLSKNKKKRVNNKSRVSVRRQQCEQKQQRKKRSQKAVKKVKQLNPVKSETQTPKTDETENAKKGQDQSQRKVETPSAKP